MKRDCLMFLWIPVLVACGSVSSRSSRIAPGQATIWAMQTDGALQATFASMTLAALPESTPAPPSQEPSPTLSANVNCYRWDEVTPAMIGQEICARGVIYDFTQTRKVGTRYSFTEEPNRFFLYSTRWEFFDPDTGKTLGPGTCIDVTGYIRVQSGVPYMNLDELTGQVPGTAVDTFNFYQDVSTCQ
jgi:hypothetical protein